MMGAAVGALLQHGGAEVLMLLQGRSKASRDRAQAAGLKEGTLAELGACDFLLSIVPPDAAGTVAREILPHLRKECVFLECNAIDPKEVREICSTMQEAGLQCVDAGLVGAAPDPAGSRSPVVYVSGDAAARCAGLREFGLTIEVLDAPVGSASALKMTFAGVSKSVTGLMAQMLAYAEQEQVLEPALQQLRRSHPGLVAWAERQFPLIDRKAGRWVQEMEILAELTRDIAGSPAHFAGLADLYRDIAGNADGAMARFVGENGRLDGAG